MSGFEDAWLAVAKSNDREAVSPKLEPLLRTIYSSILATPPTLAALKIGLEELFVFLANEGRTNANCWAADMFFCLSEGWERDWTEQPLPDDFHDVLALMGQALHDTARSPKIARNFDCLPEQLLERVKKLRVETLRSDQTS
jgi:hypothetical protein